MDELTPIELLADTQKTRAQLESGHRLANALASTAERALALCRWAANHGAFFIPLFDFDVICASLPSIVTRDLLQGRRRDLWFRSLGPHALSAMFFNRSSPSQFSLPAGAFAEVVERSNRLHGEVRTGASAWMQLLRAAKDGEGSELVQAQTPAETGQMLVDIFVDIATAFDDIRMLEMIERNHHPFDALVLGRPGGAAHRAFRDAIAHLSHRRPDVTKNNHLDALNVLKVVQMANSPVRISDRRPMPLLVTETSALLEMTQDPSWFDLSALSNRPPRLINRSYVLAFYSHFLNASDNIHGLAAKEAALFVREARNLEGHYSQLLDRIDGRGRQYSIEATEFKMARLVQEQRQFDSTWADLMLRATRSFEHDRVSYLNLLHNPHFRTHIVKQIGARIRQRDWTSAIEELESFSPPGLSFWNVANEYAARRDPPVQVRLAREFIVTVEEDSASSLVESTPQHQLERYTPGNDGERRILVHRRRGTSACLFAVDCNFSDAARETQFISIVWAHHCTRPQLASHVSRLTWFFDGGPEAAPLILRVFGRSTLKEMIYSIETLRDALTDASLLYFEIEQGKRLYFADLAAADSLEMQASLLLPQRDVDALDCRQLASEISETSIEPIAIDDAEALFEKILSVLPDVTESRQVQHA